MCTINLIFVPIFGFYFPKAASQCFGLNCVKIKAERNKRGSQLVVKDEKKALEMNINTAGKENSQKTELLKFECFD